MDDRGLIQVLLVTSRGTGRWIVPKGWPTKAGARHTAKTEAWEESGVRGKVHHRALGTFEYDKRLRKGPVRCTLKLFPLAVKKQAKRWPEMGQRKAQWFTLKEAARRCSDPALGRLLKKLTKLT